jgi:hypothetical protein
LPVPQCETLTRKLEKLHPDNSDKQHRGQVATFVATQCLPVHISSRMRFRSHFLL